MSQNPVEIAVGGVVLAAAIGFAVYAGQAAGLSRSGDSYELKASFRSVEGISVGTDVRLAGVKIGSISNLDLDPQTYRAMATLTVSQDIQVPDDSAAVISSEGLLGGNFVEISPGGSLDYFDPGGEFTDTQGSVSLISLLVKFVSGSSDE
ncbi:outer membrane lipid asymmetry maintenance protein MlaD [Chachezhania antarctica]|uniref:outer membrane lipid asymmetry maintenance protein MlaD n=1 Tax=Chachezhania antarctica TaxID=2340860 RepID=UPI000EACFD64|nr:outer membrane lipid asymmetry maintenance protein MlaD [Chachezhania antarctica]